MTIFEEEWTEQSSIEVHIASVLLVQPLLWEAVKQVADLVARHLYNGQCGHTGTQLASGASGSC